MKNPFEAIQPPKEAIKMEHLKEGIKPIMACAGTPKQFKEELGDEKTNILNAGRRVFSVHNINYYDNPRKLDSMQYKNAGWQTYVISPVDDLDKYSEQYYNCTGVVVAGQDKETKRDISFLSHQDPRFFLKSENNKRDKFTEDLTQRLNQIKEQSAEGTIDAVIIGGNYLSDERLHQSDYLKSIRLLSSKITDVFGFKPVIMTGPKNRPGEDRVFYDNKERRLYIMRETVGDKSTESYSPTDLKKTEEKWLKAS